MTDDSRPTNCYPMLESKAVRHRSRATHSRQPRQVRKEATVTGSCVCSGCPVPGFITPGLSPDFLLPHKIQDWRRKVCQVGEDSRQVRRRNAEPICQSRGVLVE
jgi:hypothetical protein